MKRRRRERGHITPRGINKYLIRWRSDGKQISKMVHGDYGIAMAELARELNDAGTAKPADRTFQSYLDSEWAQYTRDKWKGSTQITHGSFVAKHIKPYFGPMKLIEIKPATIAAFHQALEAKGLSKRTRRNVHSILTRMFSYAADVLEVIPKSPVKRGMAPQFERREKPALTQEQLANVLATVQPKLKAFYMVLALTGIRTGEALGLKWSDIDFVDSVLHIRRAIYRGAETTPKTATSIRPRPIVDALRVALLNHKQMALYTRPGDYVFSNSNGRPLNQDILRHELQRALAVNEVLFEVKRADGLHLLRHTSGSLVYQLSGGDVKRTQEWLGHSSARITTDTYVHLAKSAQKDAADDLATAIAQPRRDLTRSRFQ